VDRRKLADRRLARVSADISRFCPPPVVQAIVEQRGEGAWQIAPRRREISILFADLRGFTTLSENLEPEEIAELLNEFFGAVTEEVLRFGGTLDKYIGDAVMAFFGDPDPQPDHPERAFRAALAMQQRMRQLQVAWRAQGRPAAGMGIGLATGHATVGVTGSSSRLEYTAVGSSVNVAARLCELAQASQILTTRKSYWRIRHLIDGVSRGPATVKGFSQPVEVVEVVGAHVREKQDTAAFNQHWADVVAQIAADPSFRGLLLGNPEQVALTHNLGPREMELAEHLAVMVGSPVFANVPADEIATLTEEASLEHYERGAAVVQQGETESRFYIILQGEVVVIVEDGEHNERHVGSLTRGDYFGEVALLFDTPRTASVRAVSALTVLVLRKDAFYRVLDRAPMLQQKIESAARARASQPERGAAPVPSI
jgi:class 3 adenylate cyclase